MDINNVKQNNPKLIIDDVKALIGKHIALEEATSNILLMRGVNKWFYVRKLLISLKNRYKVRINELEFQMNQAKEAGKMSKYHRLRGRRAELIDVRQQIRALCHFPRKVNWDGLRPRKIKLPSNFPQHPNKKWFWKNSI